MDSNQAPAWEVWATRLINFATVAVLAYFILFIDFSNRGRLWDKVAAFIPGVTSQGSTMSMPKRVLAAPQESDVDRTMVLVDHVKSPAADQQAVAAKVSPSAPSGSTGPKAMMTPHLTSSLPPVSIHTEQADIMVSAPGAAASNAPQQTAASKAAAASPAVSAPATADATQAISYGTASRGEVMGRAAGPVYNLKGKSGSK
jgi:hypothetical protein